MAVKEMQNRTTNWTFDLHVENQLVCSTLNEKYFQEGNKVRLKSKEKKLCCVHNAVNLANMYS
jgi:hypothetical protein